MRLELDKYMMKLRLESKQRENQGKAPIASPDVIQTVDFTFSPFCPSGHTGDSGALLLAQQKTNHQNRYVAKHACTDCACNEFVYTKLAQAMGYTMPGAVLFQLSPTEKRRFFKTEYLIGIRYLDLEIETPSYAEIREMAANWEDYFAFLGMYAMFGESDTLETPLAKDGKIYRIDTTDAFPISMWQLDDAGINVDIQGANPHAIRKKQLLSSDFSNVLNIDWCDTYFESCQTKDKDGVKHFLEPFAHIQEIRNDFIDDFLNTLCYFYPDFIGDYFKRYICSLQKQCAIYLKDKRQGGCLL